MDALDEFTKGILALREGFAAANIDMEKVSIQISERDGMRLEHLFTQRNEFTVSEWNDPRYSKPKADNMVREFQIAGIKFWYRNKPYITPSGAIL
jgi:hypothetical protein